MENWDEIRGFESPGEYERFRRWISEAITEGALREVPCGFQLCCGNRSDEHWYRAASGQTWRLLAPDYPFKGVFEKVE
jgi:hypothetical protein